MQANVYSYNIASYVQYEELPFGVIANSIL